MKYWLIPVLAMLSGSCGLAYEILYVRLFANYFGDSFVISGVTLCAVFMGISFGAWQSLRFMRWLAWIEIAIGIYAFAVATLFSNWGFDIVSAGSSTWLNAAKLVFLLGLPAFLIGTCVPLFSVYANATMNAKSGVFTRIYGLYNLGAFLSVLAIEFLLFRHFGLQLTSYLIGSLNLAIGSALLFARYQPAEVLHSAGKTHFDKRIATTLFIASFTSGVFQLFVLRLSFSVFGPLHENFAIILASAILGVSIGAWLALRDMLRFRELPLWLALFMLVFVVFVPVFIQMWTETAGLELKDNGELLTKIALLGGFPLPMFILFGALVPLAISANGGDETQTSGRLLALSGLGNGIGSLVMFLVLYRYLSLPQIGFLIAGLLLLAGLITLKPRPSFSRILGGCVIAGSLTFAGLQTWPHVELLLGYRALLHKENIAHRIRTYEGATVYKAYDQNAALVRFTDQSSSLVLNGYQSLSFGPKSKSEMHEVIVGATPILFGDTLKTAIVFGLGSGITGGATARFYDDTKIVEINPAILNMPQHFTRENQNVMTRANVTVALEDGISSLLTHPKRYDVVINTVTSPQYYSAAKLYTEDFYEIVKSRLTDGGMYSSWFDVNIDREGIAIMLNTLEASFTHCRYFLLSRGYFNVVCSDRPLIYKSSPEIRARVAGSDLDELFARYGYKAGFRDTMEALELDFDPKFFKRYSSAINTLDYPAIEFVVARERDASDTIETLGEMIVANIDFQRKTAFGNQGWRRNCRILSQMSGLEFSGC